MHAKHFLALAAAGIAASSIVGGCSSSVDETGGGGTGGVPTTTTTTTFTTSTTTNTGTTSTTSTETDDGNDSCAEAAIYVDEADSEGWWQGAIQAEGDADYVKVPLEEGEFVILAANVPDLDADDPSYDYDEWLDNVVSLYDEAGTTLIATIDDAFPRYDTNAELVIRVPATATYCVKIEDWGSWDGDVRPVQTNNTYEFAVLSPIVDDGNVWDTETNDDETEAQPLTYFTSDTSNSVYSNVYGGLDAAGDVDVYAFTMDAATTGMLLEDFTPRSGPGSAGENGNGSTLELGLINITNADGTEIFAQLDASRGANSIFAPMVAGATYLMWVQRLGSSTAGTNDFYDLQQLLIDSETMNEAETEVTVGDNDAVADAEAPTADDSLGYPRYFFQGNIGDSDVDNWLIPLESGDQVNLSCGAARNGSGLTGMTVKLIASDGSTVVEEETETEDADLWWYTSEYGDGSKPGVSIDTTGNYYVQISAGGQKANVTGSFYLCGVVDVKP